MNNVLHDFNLKKAYFIIYCMGKKSKQNTTISKTPDPKPCQQFQAQKGKIRDHESNCIGWFFASDHMFQLLQRTLF